MEYVMGCDGQAQVSRVHKPLDCMLHQDLQSIAPSLDKHIFQYGNEFYFIFQVLIEVKGA